MAMLSTDHVAGHGRSGPSFLERLVMRVNGAGLLMAALGLWFVPYLEQVPEMTLMKLAISAFMALAGAGLILAARRGRR